MLVITEDAVLKRMVRLVPEVAGVRCTYCKYFVIGSIVGVSAIIAREIIGILLPADTPAFYILSVILVYTAGILASFYGHYRVTFAHIIHKRAVLESIVKFTVIAIIGMIITAILSWQIRYALGLERIIGKLLPAFAFGSATVIASLVTYNLNSRFTFSEAGCESGKADSKAGENRMVQEGRGK